MTGGAPSCDGAPEVDLRRAFAPLDADDLEVLDAFLDDAEIVANSRFADHLDDLGVRPQMVVDRRFADGSGTGRLRVTSVSRAVRHEVFPTLRKLRTESNWASLAAVRNLLHRRARRMRTDEAMQVMRWLGGIQVRIRDARDGEALVRFKVEDTTGTRVYDRTGAVLSLAQNGSVFHNDRAKRRDLRALPGPLVDPAVDDGLRQIAEITIALARLAVGVMAEPALRRR